MCEEELGMSEQSDSAQPHITHKKIYKNVNSYISDLRSTRT